MIAFASMTEEAVSVESAAGANLARSGGGVPGKPGTVQLQVAQVVARGAAQRSKSKSKSKRERERERERETEQEKEKE
jgi:hypothetical protein